MSRCAIFEPVSAQGDALSMGEIRFRCPNCTYEAVVSEEMTGQEFYCRYCGRKLIVPQRSEPDRCAVGARGLYGVDSEPYDVRRRGEKNFPPEYRCEVCGTCIAVFEAEIGKRKLCPDCDTPFTVTRSWYDEALRRREEARKNSWTDPTLCTASDEDPDAPPPESYDIVPSTASKPSELLIRYKPRKVMVSTPCATCGTILRIEKSQIGKKVHCPDCATSFLVTRDWFAAERRRHKQRRKSASGSSSSRISSRPRERSAGPERKRTKQNPPLPARKELVPFYCDLCGSLFYVKRSQVGMRVSCLDCGRRVTVTKEQYDRARRHDALRQKRLSYGSRPSAPSQPFHSAASRPNHGFAASPPFSGQAGAIPPKTEKSASDLSKQNAPSPPSDDEPIPVYCGLCGTLLYAKRSQIGSKIECPDCESYTTVIPPLHSRHETEPSFSGGYSLSGEDLPPIIGKKDSEPDSGKTLGKKN